MSHIILCMSSHPTLIQENLETLDFAIAAGLTKNNDEFEATIT